MVHFEIRNLTFEYPTSDKKVLKNINLKINKGEYVTICGKSGSGKTTLLKHLKAPLVPYGKREGQVLFNMGKTGEQKIICSAGSEGTIDLRSDASSIGFVMQNPDNQIVTDKVWHELAFGLENLGLDTETIRLRVAEMASFFGIQGWFYKNVNELSGGEKQLLNLAGIMAMQPEVIICDEPTSQLDPVAASDFLHMVRRINLETGTTVIMSEQRLEDVFPLSDKIVVIDDGEIIACDKPALAAEKLYKNGHDMMMALPAPARIYYGVNGKTYVKNSNVSNDTDNIGITDKNVPLTVREGRSWLEDIFTDESGIIIRPKNLSGENIFKNKTSSNSVKGKPVISVKDVWFRYERDGADVLKGTCLDIPQGSIYAITGGNGTGKTTLLKAICGFCKPYRGSITVEGKKLERYKKGELFENRIAMLPQSPQALFVKKTVREELMEMDTEHVDAIAKKCNITQIMDCHPYDISGGEQQRVALAKVLLARPGILLLDEPTKGMDGFFKKEFADILKSLKDVTVVMVSHDIEFCAKYCDMACLFFDGNVMASGDTHRFFAGNGFYTTSANRMSKGISENLITAEEVIDLCTENIT